MGMSAHQAAGLMVVTDDEAHDDVRQANLDQIFSGIDLDFNACVLFQTGAAHLSASATLQSRQ